MTLIHERICRLLGIAAAAFLLTGCPTGGSSTAPATHTNTPPVISGTPAASATVSCGYSFAPTASDADGDLLTFSIQQQPTWTDFDPETGQLSGQPGNADIGIHSGTVISVSDGDKSASLPAFSIEVTAQGEEPPSPPPPPGEEIARNVPHPADFFGWDPLTFDPPTTQTVSSVPSSVSAGSSILVTGTGGENRVTFNCTQAAPCLLKSSCAVRSQAIQVSGSHFVVDGFVFQGDDTGSIYVVNAIFAAVRNTEHGGTNTTTSNGTSMSAEGANNNVVFYNNHIHNIARNDGSSEVDHMGLTVADGSNTWVIDNHIHEVGADSLKLGQNVSRAGGIFPTNIWVTGNRFYGNGENPIDIKWSQDIWIVDNELYGVSASVSSSGEAIVIHESGDFVHILDNYIHDVRVGVETATSGGGASYIEVDGNTFENMDIGVHNRGGGHADVTNNTFTDVDQPIVTDTNNGSTTTASGNN